MGEYPMAKYLYSSVIGVILLTSAISQSFAGSTVSLPLQLKPFSKAIIDYILVKEKDGKTNKAHIMGMLEIQLLTNDGFEASWTTNSVEMGGVVIDKSSPLAASLFIGIPFRFISDKNGLPTKVVNLDNLTNSIFKSEIFAKADATVLKRTMKFINDLSDDVAAEWLFKVPSYMAICQGTNLELGVLHKDQGQIPSPMGNGTIVSDVTYKLSSINDELKTATIEFRSNFNPDSLKTAVEQAVAKIRPNEKKFANKIEDFEVSRKDTADCTVDTNTGWVKNMTYTTAITVAEKSRSERYDVSIRWTD
ncbi:MAG: hypothetical protein GY751_17535 [Bacteroidetes bacterium]|nr:hypothetical protein [Bacteroidota bacterium]